MTPIFSGSSGEDIERYINQCEWAWAGSQIPKEDLSRAQVTTLYGGLKGNALDFANGLNQEARQSFQSLSQRLKERFPFRERRESQRQVLDQIRHLKQGERSLDAYVEEGRRLLHSDGETLNEFLIDQWVDGLKYEPAVGIVRGLVGEWRRSGEIVGFEEVVRAAQGAHGRLASTYKED